MARPTPIALDHNFPKPILAKLAKYLPEVSLHWLHDVDPELAELQDHDLIVQLHRIGFGVLLTGDYKMLSDVRVLVALDQTRMSVLTAKGVGDDPLLATGVVLRDLLPLLRNNQPRGLVYIAHPSTIRPQRAYHILKEMAEDSNRDVYDVVREHRRPYSERSRYPEDDPRRKV